MPSHMPSKPTDRAAGAAQPEIDREHLPHAADSEVAVFDFDGTLTHRDSFLSFLRFVAPVPRLLTGFGWAAPTLVGHAVRLVPNWVAKEALLTGIVRGMT